MVDFLTVKVGSRGHVNYGSFTHLKDAVDTFDKLMNYKTCYSLSLEQLL